jgi:hypothetical protein
VQDLLLDPKIPSVVGEIRVPGLPAGSDGISVSMASRETAAGGNGGEVEGRPEATGPFAIFDVSPGTWALHVMARTPAGVRWARRVFDVGGATVDLGAIEVSGWADLRVRLLDGEGRPVARTQIMINAVDDPITGVGVGWQRRVETRWPSGNQGGEGWVDFVQLSPVTRYQLTVPDQPFAGTEVTTSAENGATTMIELRTPAKATPCVLRMTLAGKKAESWADASDGNAMLPLSRDGILRCSIPPGKHTIDLQVQPTPDGNMERRQVLVEIPDQPAYEATIDVER